jgi:hypothetical protein
MKVLGIVLFVACDFQPAPPVPPIAPPLERDAAAAVVVTDAGVAKPDAIAVTSACLQTATHIADVLITTQKDPSLKSSYETARDRIVYATAEACTTQNWSDAALKCFADAKLEADLQACEKKFPPPKAAPKPDSP